MKALFVHDHRFPMHKGIYYQSYGFDEEFFKRYLLVFKHFEVIGRTSNIPQEEVKKSLKVDENIVFSTIDNYSKMRLKKVRKIIDEKIAESDCVIIRLPSFIGLYAINSANKQGKPYLVEVVGSMWDSLWYQNTTKKIIAPFMTWMCKKAIKNAEFVVYVTEKYLQKAYPTSGKSIACSNVTIPNVEDNNLQKRLKKISDPSNSNIITIGTCSTLNVYKGQQDVIKAMSKLKSEGYKLKYQLVGGGDKSYLKSIAEKYNVNEDVEFLGKLKHEEVFAWMDDIDIYIQPSLTEGLPRSVVEAMSRACPIIGSNAGGIPELIDESVIYNKGDIKSIVNLLKSFSPEVMKKNSVLNHEHSKKYLKSVLYQRRTEFFNEFIKQIDSQKNSNKTI